MQFEKRIVVIAKLLIELLIINLILLKPLRRNLELHQGKKNPLAIVTVLPALVEMIEGVCRPIAAKF